MILILYHICVDNTNLAVEEEEEDDRAKTPRRRAASNRRGRQSEVNEVIASPEVTRPRRQAKTPKA